MFTFAELNRLRDALFMARRRCQSQLPNSHHAELYLLHMIDDFDELIERIGVIQDDYLETIGFKEAGFYDM